MESRKGLSEKVVFKLTLTGGCLLVWLGSGERKSLACTEALEEKESSVRPERKLKRPHGWIQGKRRAWSEPEKVTRTIQHHMGLVGQVKEPGVS